MESDQASSDPAPGPDREAVRRPESAAGPILFAVLATLVVRVLVALSRLDELELERYTGNFAWALIHGVRLDPASLPIIPHLRGSVVFGVLAVPFLWLGGPTLASVKALAIVSSMVGAGLLAALTTRTFGRRGGYLAGALLALAPPSFQMVDVLALGSHTDTIPYFLALLWLLVGGRGQPGLGRYAAIGTVAGAALFFSMQLWVALPAVVAAGYVFDRQLAFRRGALVALVAALPWIALIPVVSRSTTLVNKPVESQFIDGNWGELLGKLGEGFASEFPRSWLFASNGVGWGMWVLGAVVFAGLLAAALRIPWRRLLWGRPWTRVEALRLYCLLHFAALFMAYAASDFRINLIADLDGMGSRYFMPLVPAIAILTIDLVDGLSQRSRGLALGTVGATLATAAAGVASLLTPTLGLRQPPVSATEFYAFGPHIPYAAGPSMQARLALLDRLEPDWGGYRALAQRAAFVSRDFYSREDLVAELERVAADPPELQRFRYANLGSMAAEQVFDQLAVSSRFQVPLAEREALLIETFRNFFAEALQSLDGPAERWFLRGAGRQLHMVQVAGMVPAFLRGDGTPELAARIGFRVLAALPVGAREHAVQGMGFQLGLRFAPYEIHPPEVLAALDELPAPARTAYMEWLARGFRLRFQERRFDAEAPLSIRAFLAPEDVPRFDAGLRAPARPLD
ncbi:MAG: hypothetical protein AAFZ65_01410 [Planctomycetota bacterium]